MAKFCMECGTALPPGCKFCPECGTVNGGAANGGSTYQQYGTPQYNTPRYGAPQYGNSYGGYNSGYTYGGYSAPPRPTGIVKEVATKANIEAILWVIAAGLQLILGLIYLLSGEEYILSGFIFLILAIANGAFAVSAFNFAKRLNESPVGVLRRYSSGGRIFAIIAWSIFGGGFIGIAAAIYACVVRSYVMSREMEFYKIEEDFIKNN